ncbi:MAG: Asp23/Gls24 family envelope stress response protein [Lachnospiraceae bacterium]|nr:Asp23/Gls24 family envelope stress response protein [Lachnospiraceae bacterium]
MSQDKKVHDKKSAAEIGVIRIADDVVAMIAAFAAMDVDGVATMAGGADRKELNAGGMKRLGKDVKVEVREGVVNVDMSIVMVYGFNIPSTSSNVQSRVKTAIETMTGLEVRDVNIRIAGIAMQDQ